MVSQIASLSRTAA
jgi:aspartate racemase